MPVNNHAAGRNNTTHELAGGGVRLERGACMPAESRSGLAAERPWSPSVSAPHRESLARHTGPGLLTYLIVPKVPKELSISSARQERAK
jgi:hypothetical protein